MVLVAVVPAAILSFQASHQGRPEATVTTEAFIIAVFCEIDDQLSPLPKHPQAKLWPSEVITIGILFALKGGSFRAFARWLRRDYEPLFGHLPHRTRLHRLLLVHQRWCQHFLAQPSLFTVIDTYGIELIHPIREGRSPHQLGKKGKSNWRWIVGMKLCWVINTHGHVVAWASRTANTADQHFLPLVTALADRSIVLSDRGFHAAQGDPPNLKLCRRGEWNERMLIETAFSLLTTVCGLKKVWHRTVAAFQMRLAYVAAMFNTLLTLNPTLPPATPSPTAPFHLAHFAL